MLAKKARSHDQAAAFFLLQLLFSRLEVIVSSGIVIGMVRCFIMDNNEMLNFASSSMGGVSAMSGPSYVDMNLDILFLDCSVDFTTSNTFQWP